MPSILAKNSGIFLLKYCKFLKNKKENASPFAVLFSEYSFRYSYKLNISVATYNSLNEDNEIIRK